MAFFKFSKNVCLGALLGFGLIGTAQAYDDEDVLGQFLEQKVSNLVNNHSNLFKTKLIMLPIITTITTTTMILLLLTRSLLPISVIPRQTTSNIRLLMQGPC